MADEHGRAMSEEFGIRLDPVKADEAEGSGQYLTKVGYELAMADTKIGREDGHRTPFAIMHDAAETGDMADITLMREWITASYRKHSISWSQDVRQALGLGEDKTDDGLASEDPGGETVAEIDRPLWRLLAARRDGARAQLLTAFEIDYNRRCIAAAVEYLVDLGYPVGVDEAGPVPVIGLVTNPPQTTGATIVLSTKPIDADQLTFRYSRSAEHYEYDRDTQKRASEQTRDEDTGYPLWKIRCVAVYRQVGEHGEITATVPHPEPPAAEFDSEISFTEMTVKDWS